LYIAKVLSEGRKDQRRREPQHPQHPSDTVQHRRRWPNFGYWRYPGKLRGWLSGEADRRNLQRHGCLHFRYWPSLHKGEEHGVHTPEWCYCPVEAFGAW